MNQISKDIYKAGTFICSGNPILLKGMDIYNSAIRTPNINSPYVIQNFHQKHPYVSQKISWNGSVVQDVLLYLQVYFTDVFI